MNIDINIHIIVVVFINISAVVIRATKMFSAAAPPATLLLQFGTHYRLISLIILTACFRLVLNAASICISTNSHLQPSHKRCPQLRFVF